ncbi:MAG: hypothetical protein MRZ84_02840 [Eubacterium sp.]|nr:hypothetical protein [Eubacterium sp.]
MFSTLRFPSLFVCFLIFIAWMHYKKRKATKQQEKESKEFWQREEEANHTRKKDISHLPLFTPDSSRIPWEYTQNETIRHYLDKLRRCMDKPMMDLSEYTNTDLKLAYGIGNFQTLSEYDETYQTFIQNLSALANAYFEVGDLTRAREVSRLCIDYDPINRVAYLTLANTYKKEGNSHGLADLKQEIIQSPLPRKESLLREIDH